MRFQKQNVLIRFESLSRLFALQDLRYQDFLVKEIINFLQSTKKQIFLEWVRAHVGHLGNELPDILEKEAMKDNKTSFLLLLSSYNLKYSWKKENWQIGKISGI